MNYEQSLKNLSLLKNFSSPWTVCQMFFFFSLQNDYEFKICEGEITEEQKEDIVDHRIKGFPYGYLCLKNSGEELMFYHDINMSVEFDLFAQELISIDFHDPIDMELVRQQFELLFKFLKNK